MHRLRPLLALFALIFALLLNACGGSSPSTQQHVHRATTSTATITTPAPEPAPLKEGYTRCSDGKVVKAEAGACIKQELHGQGFRLIPPLTAAGGRAQCIDISRWQPHPQFHVLYGQGIRCVIVQGADNEHASNPFFASQIRSAHEAGMKVGVYIFAEGAFGIYQANALIQVAHSERSRITLGAAIDAEVSSAYPQVCRIAQTLERSFYLVYVYGSPGTYRGGRCTKYVWPAVWGTRSPIPLSGYSSSAIVFWQWCGTCRLLGNDGEIDRDEDRGLIGLSKAKPKPKPKPLTPSQKKAKLRKLDQLLGAYVPANEVEAPTRQFNPHGHNCQHPPFKHAYPSARYNGACEQWAREAKALRR